MPITCKHHSKCIIIKTYLLASFSPCASCRLTSVRFICSSKRLCAHGCVCVCVCAPGLADAMRQLKGKPKKESWKDKKERKQAMQEAREQVATVVLPTLAILILLIILFVYVATRPGAVQ